MLSRVRSASTFGVDAYTIEVEVDLAPGIHSFTVVGLPDAAVKESRDRVEAAIKNSGYVFPGGKRVTVNLAPADIKKEGTALDLPIALGILASAGQVPRAMGRLSGRRAKKGMVRLRRHCLKLVHKGVTTVEEFEKAKF